MRVLLIGRTDAHQKPGGDMLHLARTAEALRSLGVDVQISHEASPVLTGVEVAHLFNLTRDREALRHARRLRQAGIPFAITPIFIQADRYRVEGRPGGRFFVWWAPSLTRMAEVLRMSQLVLPNTNREADALQRVFGHLPMRIVPVGLDRPLGRAAGHQVLCFARIEPLKNQLRLVEALADTGLPLVLAGATSRRFKGYARHVLDRLGRMGGTYLGELSHDAIQSRLLDGKVHVQPSWFETLGMASLEAASHGLNVVITQEGYARELFGDGAEYVDPGSPRSIREAVLRAYQAPRQNWGERLSDDFSWCRAAQETLAAYRLLVEVERP